MTPHATQAAFLIDGHRFVGCAAGAQCLPGDVMVGINRAGKSFHERLERVVARWRGDDGRWNPEIRTTIRFGDERGSIRLTTLVGAMFSGRKSLLAIKHARGAVRVSPDHRVLTSAGWLRASEIRPGDAVMAEGPAQRTPRKLAHYRTCFLPHPFANRKGVRNGVHREGVYKHRLVMEAALNELTCDDFCERLRAREWHGLRFLRSDEYVHHVDGDVWSNALTNLELTDARAHSRQHGLDGAWRHVTASVVPSVVSSIQDCGEADTFDLEVAAPEHNFLADGVVVHNSGKTCAAAHKFANRVITTYGLRCEAGTRQSLANFWVVTPTYELATMPQRYLRERWPNGWRERRAGVWLECEPYPGCVVKFRSAEHPDKLVSEPVDGLWLNETARMKADAWRGGLRMRLNATGGWAIWDTTPMGQNWVYSDLYLPGLRAGEREHDQEQEDVAYRAYSWRTIDNPGVPAGEVDQARKRLPASFFAREYEADFSAFHGQIWPDFKKEVHAATKLRASDYPEIVLGIDWGFTPGHLGVILVVGIDRAKRRAGILEEYAHEGWTDDRWQDLLVALIEKHPVARVWCDPARPGELAGMRKRVALEVDRVRKSGGHARMVPIREAHNEVYSGLMCIAELTHTGGLAVDPSCTQTIRQFLTYHWAKGTQQRGGEWLDAPAKIDDDLCDAARYAIYSELRRTEVSGR